MGSTRPPDPAERVRLHLVRWLEDTGKNQRQFAEGDLQKSQVWLQKILAGENHVRLRDLDQIAAAMRTTASELVRSADARYEIEATPTELRIIEQLRHHPEIIDAVLTILKIREIPKTVPKRVTRAERL